MSHRKWSLSLRFEFRRGTPCSRRPRPSSVLAFHVRSICEVDLGIWLKPVGVDGGVLSGAFTSTLNATICMTQGLLLTAWLAEASYDPTSVTFLSSVRLPKSPEREVKPLPTLLTLLADAPAPKMRSLAFFVVRQSTTHRRGHAGAGG